MKRTYLILLLVFVLSSSIVAGLYLMQPAPAKNGFNRGHIYTARKLNELQLNFGHFYIDRLDSSRIYLRNYTALLALFSCGYDLQDSVYGKAAYNDEPKKLLELVRQRVAKKIDPNGSIFNVDGFMSLNDKAQRVLYTYYYRNSFACLDVNLNVLYKARMIDTNTVAKLKLGEYAEADRRVETMAAPAKAINKRGYTDGNWYYNHSALAADNETYEVFKAHEVFDVYQLSDGRYSHSVYLPEHGGGKLTDFALRGDTLIALYEKVLVTYSLKGKEVLAAR